MLDAGWLKVGECFEVWGTNPCLTHYKDVVMKLKWSLLPRYSVFLLCVLGALVCLLLTQQTPWVWPLAVIFLLLVAVGTQRTCGGCRITPCGATTR